jgi:ComF family protein
MGLGRLFDLIFPPRCVHCQQVVERGAVLCVTCYAAVGPAARFAFSGFEVAAAFPLRGAGQSLVHALKYGGRPDVAPAIAALIAERLGPRWPVSCDVLIPVPLHPRRRRARGFNQSLLLARALGRRWGVPVLEPVTRVRATKAQTALGAEERHGNVARAFAWSGARPCGRSAWETLRVMVVDDVVTTGSTLTEVMRVCAAVPVGEVGGLAAAAAGLVAAPTPFPGSGLDKSGHAP